MRRKSVTIKAAWIGAGATLFTTLIVFIFDITIKNNDISNEGNGTTQNIENVEGDVVSGNKITNETNIINEKEDLSENPSNFQKVLESNELNLNSYKINQVIKLNNFSNSFNGAVLLLTDNKLEGISGDLEFDGYSNTYLPNFRTKDADPLSNEKYKQAIVVLVNDRLKILYYEELGRESARIDRIFPYTQKNKPVFVVTTDYSAGWGSYSGPVSYFLEINENGIQYILDKQGFMTSLKSMWLIKNRKGKSEILDLDCRPDFDSDSENTKFKLIYTWYFIKNGKWEYIRKEKSGFWENYWDLESFQIDNYYEIVDPDKTIRNTL